MHLKALHLFIYIILYTAGVIASTTCPDGTIVSNKQCCTLVPVLQDLRQNFFGTTEECPALARSILRLAFHDAIGFSNNATVSGGGGADGSILVYDDVELEYPGNSGLQTSVFLLNRFMRRHSISPGDLLHFAAAVGLSTCPGAPRVEFLLGRPLPTEPAPDFSIPETTDSADDIISRFADAGLNAEELVALMAAHSIAGANVDNTPGIAIPLDTTPQIFDTQFYLEVLLPGTIHMNPIPGGPQVTLSPIPGTTRLPSDLAIATHPTTSCAWQGLINEQRKTSQQFQQAMLKLSTLGQKIENMIDCSELIPVPPPPPIVSAQLSHLFKPENITQTCSTKLNNPSRIGVEKRSPLKYLNFPATLRDLTLYAIRPALPCPFHLKREERSAEPGFTCPFHVKREEGNADILPSVAIQPLEPIFTCPFHVKRGESPPDPVSSLKQTPAPVEAQAPPPEVQPALCAFHAKRAQTPTDISQTSLKHTEVCCGQVGLPADDVISPTLHSIGMEGFSPTKGLIGVNCKSLRDASVRASCPKFHSLACITFANSPDGPVGFSCSPIDVIR